MKRFSLGCTIAVVVLAWGRPCAAREPLRIGIIGLDTSHVVAFTRVFNDPNAEGDLADMKVVAAFPGGSPDIPSSANRLQKFTDQLKDEFGVEIVDSIHKLLEKVDVVLLESVDGRPHLEQVRPVLKAGKRVFIDKPVAGSLEDAVAIYALAEEAGVPIFSSSSLRFSKGVYEMADHPKIGKVIGCAAFSPCSLEEHHPDLYWYGIHGVELLYTIMGPGCQSVTRVQTPGAELVVGTWSDGRVGTFRGIRSGKGDYGAMVFGEKGIAPSGGYEGYEPLVVEISRYFKTGVVPVEPEETLEIFAFMEAADESKRRGGRPVSINEVLTRARKTAAAKSN